MKFKSLKTRVLVWFGSITIILLLIFSFSFHYFFNKSINLSVETKLYQQASYIHNKLLPKLKESQIIKGDRFSSLQIAIIKDKKIINHTNKFTFSNWNNYINKSGSFFIVDDGEHINGIYNYKFNSPFVGSILIYKESIDDRAENILSTLLILNPILLILLLLLGNKLIGKVLTPIKSVTSIARNISITNFSRTIPLPKEDNEIKDLVDSFNEMVKRLKDGVGKIDRFNSDVSHELKTPLTVIKGEVEIALKKIREPEYYENSLETIAYEANLIQKIVDDLLLLTKFSKDNIKTTFEVCNLDVILLGTIDKYSQMAKNKNIKLHVDRLESIITEANALLIERIFSNLIDNAIKYTPKNKNIHISLYKNKDIHFTILDEGIGIPPKHISKITDRFYRIDESRNKKIKGFGIGLSIVKNSVELHNGELSITSKEKEGTTVEVIL